MKKVYILLCALAALAAASCTDKEEQPALLSGVKVAREFSTLLTKTTLGGTSVYWEEDDAISVFDGVSNNKFDITGYDNDSPSASATFAGEVDGGANTFYAVYPYAAGNSLAGSTLTASVPASQTLRANSFTSGAALAVAYTKSNSLAFHQATAILGITLESYMTDVESIEFSGNGDEYVAGAVSIAMNTSTGAISSVTPGTGSKKVTLTGTFVAGQTYYLAFIPQTFSSGMKVIVTFDSGKTAIATSDKSLATSAGIIYPIADFTRVSLPYAAFAAKNSFNYDAGTPQNLVPESFANIASISVDDGPSGWDIAWNTDHFEVTPPTLAEIQADPQTVAPAGVFELTLRSAAGHTREVELPVRLYGINSSEEFNEFRLAYGNGKDSFAAGTSYDRRLTDCADYLVGEEITLNDNISAVEQNSTYKYFIIHHIEHNLNGNGKTFTMNITSDAWPAGFCQVLRGATKIHDINLAGTLNWTYSAAGSDAGCCGGFAGQLSGAGSTSVEFENVNNAVDIIWTSASTDDPSKNHSVGGFIGYASGLTATFKNCTYSGTISKNCRNLAVGGFVGWNSGANKSYFDGCTFSGTINDNATSSKSAWKTSTNLEFIGGFVGASDGNASALIEFKGCESAGTIKIASGAREVGGFVGKGSCPITFADNESGTHCVFSGEIDYKDSEVNTTATKAIGLVGGFVGYKTANSTSFSKCVFSSTGKLTIDGGAYSAGGFMGTTEKNGTDDAATFVDCDMEGTFDYTTFSSYSSSPTNLLGRIGGFVGELGNDAIVSFSTCNVTSSAKLLCHKDYSNFGGFVGNGGGNSASVTFTDCAFHGLLSHTASTGNGARRMGGFIGDASRIVKLTNCVVDGDLQLHENNKGTVAFGGIVGRTTAQNGTVGSPHTMKCDLVNCVFSGTMKVYNPKANTVHGTLIGANAGYAVTTIDGISSGTTNAAINYGTTAPEFLTE